MPQCASHKCLMKCHLVIHANFVLAVNRDLTLRQAQSAGHSVGQEVSLTELADVTTKICRSGWTEATFSKSWFAVCVRASQLDFFKPAFCCYLWGTLMFSFDHIAGPSRVVIENVTPSVACGRFAVKRTIGDTIGVEADIFADGHDELAAVVLSRHAIDAGWNESEMSPFLPARRDHWRGEFTAAALGKMIFTIEAWIDRFRTWRRNLRARLLAGQDTALDMLLGRELLNEAAMFATNSDRARLSEWSASLNDMPSELRLDLCDNSDLSLLMWKYLPRLHATRLDTEFPVTVDPELAGFSTWYELFPRSTANQADTHGTFKDVIKRLPYISAMEFDILYLPPIHPVGRTYRKGRNNSIAAASTDPGSVWAVGAEEGGHTALHPELGTLDDFRELVQSASQLKLEIALDLAFQCSPDHPYVKEHPEWFRHRPDGSIQYAENPPKRYQDIYPFDFECAAWRELWTELRSVVLYWIKQGISIFRVDNPHTKPFAFWEWLITSVKSEHPETIFLSEAFTRPAVMERLAKVGFTQSYTYFTWRNTKQELIEYMNYLRRPEIQEIFRPNFWPNTPDILPEYLQLGGRPAFMARLVLAATLSPNYGIYGPAFELSWADPTIPGSEEYLDSEKYQWRAHDLEHPASLRHFIARMNRVRREHAALQTVHGLRFHDIDNPQLICYSRSTVDHSELLLCVVNLDPHHEQSGWLNIPLADFSLDAEHGYQLHDLLSEARYLWHGDCNFVTLKPEVCPAHIFRIRRKLRREQDFEYYL